MTDLAGLNIKYLPGVGPKRAELLNKELEIFTYLDLLHYYPYKYIDRSKTYKINEIDGSMPYIQLRGKIVSYTTHGEGARRRLTALFSDGSGVIELVWFKGIRYITDRYKPGTEYTLFGKPTLFNGKFNIAHPELDPIDDRIDNTTGLQGYYTTTEKMKNAFLNSKAIQKMVYTLLSGIQNPLPETLPLPIISRMQLMSSTDALCNIHFPVTIGHLRRAEFRLKFEELFYLQLHILRYTRLRNLKLGGFRFDHIGNYFNDFYHQVLPFELTQAQRDSSRYGQRQTNEQTVTGRCRQWKNIGRAHEYAHRRRQRLPSLSNGSHRNIGHPALRRAEKDGRAVRTTY